VGVDGTGQLVDTWSSLELKRLLYVTNGASYASSPALAHAAVYSKSGSWWGCQEEPGFTCRPYHGNLRNYMNSVSIVEEQIGGQKIGEGQTGEGQASDDQIGEVSLHYIVVLISNVLKENSAVVHQNMATRIHHLILRQHGAPVETQDTD
jgi:hypothetical protein